MYLGAMAAFLLSIFWKPQVGLYFLVPLLPMQTARYWLHDLPFGEKLIDFLLLGILLGLLTRTERPIFVVSPLTKFIAVFSALLYLGLWQGALFLGAPLPLSFADPRFSDWKNYVEMMMFFIIVAATVRTPKQILVLISLICFSVLVVNRSYYDTVGDRDFSQFSDSLRDAGALGYAGENGMGAFQAQMGVFLVAMGSFANRKLWKLILWALSATSVYCLAVTFSRGAYIGFLVGLFVLGLMKERKLLILLCVFLVGWESFVPGAVKDRINMTYRQGQGVDESSGDRLTLWQDAMQQFAEQPVLGTGYDTYKYMGRVGSFSDTHNYYVKVLLEMGLVGLMAFMSMLFVAARMAWQLSRTAQDPLLKSLGTAVFAMFICTMVVNLFGDRWTFVQVNGLLWVLLGLVARGLFTVKHQQMAEESGIEEPSLSPSVTLGASHV